MFISLNRLGSVVIDVDGLRLDAQFLRETGVIDDAFTIIKGAPQEPLRFATFRVIDGRVNAQWKSVSGRTYRIERALSLKDPEWFPISTNIVATGATSSWSEPVIAGAQQSFYRVVLLD
jgi:hypothetical protein